MLLPSLHDIKEIYERAANYHIQRYRVKYAEFSKFSISLNQLKNDLGDTGVEPYWQKYFSDLRRFRFGLCAAPFLNTYRDERILELYSSLSDHLRHCSSIYPEFAQAALDILGHLMVLHGDNKNPLLEKLIELSRTSGTIAWVVKESRLIAHIDEVVEANKEALGYIDVAHYTQLSKTKCFDAVVVIGSPVWYPDSLFTSPRAYDISIVQYNWMRDSWKIPDTFLAQYSPTRIRRVTFTDHNISAETDLAAEIILLQVDKDAVAAHASKDRHEDYEEVEARCVVLEGEQAIFVESDESAKILIIDIDEEALDRLKPMPVRDLKQGTFVLVRTSGGGDYIVPLADEIMGPDSQLARQRQKEWKRHLQQYVSDHGLFKTSVDLLTLGSQIAEEANVKNWIYPRNIKTRSFEDFLAIMRLVGLEAQALEYWNSMEFIDSAHRKAGFRLRNMLLSQIDQIDTEELMRKGKFEFKLSESDDNARLTAFRVENVLATTYKVSFSRIGIPFRLGT